MAGAFIFCVAGAEMAPMVAGIENNGVVLDAIGFQGVHQAAYIGIKAVAGAKVIRVIFPPVALGPHQIAGNVVVGKFFLAPVGAFIVVPVVLVVGVKLGDKEEERLVRSLFLLLLHVAMDKVYGIIGDCVYPEAGS